MAILIKSMDMPTECEYCGFCRYYPENGNVWCNAKNRLLKMNWEKPHWTHLDVKRPDWCPLEALPSAQSEIVRCKDCKFWREHKYAKGTKRYIPFCGLNAIYTKSDDFCSKGERRTDD